MVDPIEHARDERLDDAILLPYEQARSTVMCSAMALRDLRHETPRIGSVDVHAVRKSRSRMNIGQQFGQPECIDGFAGPDHFVFTGVVGTVGTVAGFVPQSIWVFVTCSMTPCAPWNAASAVFCTAAR